MVLSASNVSASHVPHHVAVLEAHHTSQVGAQVYVVDITALEAMLLTSEPDVKRSQVQLLDQLETHATVVPRLVCQPHLISVVYLTCKS